MFSVPLSVVILTYNEELNLPAAVRSISSLARDVFVFDSYSTDSTVELAKKLGCHVMQHRFVDYGKQRNAALDKLQFNTEWVLFLDADEQVSPELAKELAELLASDPPLDGYYVNRRFIWMGKWIRRGYYPTSILRLFRRSKARCEHRSVNEHIVVQGKVGALKNDLIHDDRKGVVDWTHKHVTYAQREAAEALRRRIGDQATPLTSSQASRTRWLRERVWNRLPPLIRPFAYFAYRYVARGGFLDGKAALSFHLLQALWYPFLTDVIYLEMVRARPDQGDAEAGKNEKEQPCVSST